MQSPFISSRKYVPIDTGTLVGDFCRVDDPDSSALGFQAGLDPSRFCAEQLS